MPNSVIRFVPDAAYRIRAADAAAITASTLISAGELVSPIGAPWNDAVKDGKVVLFYNVADADVSGNQTYRIDVVTSANEDLSGSVVSLSKEVEADGWFDVLIDQVSLLAENPGAKYWGINVVVGGTGPSVKIEAYILPPVGK